MARSERGRNGEPVATAAASGQRFPLQLMHTAARLYYLEDATQATIADRLGTSRATVSRLLSEARRQGIVRIEVVEPVDVDVAKLARKVERTLGLEVVHLSPLPVGTPRGLALAPGLYAALDAVDMSAGDVLLVSSGRTVQEASSAELPSKAGVLVAPMVGGNDEPEPWYQTNEISRQVAATIGGTPRFLYAPAVPGPRLHRTLLADPSTRRIFDLWEEAQCAIIGIGVPPFATSSITRFVSADTIRSCNAVGDVCSHFFDRDGAPIELPGSDRLLATSPDVLRRIPACIAIAAGEEKVDAIAAGAAAGYFNHLVTDVDTATALVERGGSRRGRR